MRRLDESVGFNASESGNKWRIKVIEAGWGSSGYYGADMLKEYGPQVFKSGTKVFMNHPSAGEANDRPERDVHQLAGKLVSDATFNESDKSLYADVQFYSHYAPIIKEMAGDVGLSIHALGNAQMGEADGRKGPIVESLVADPLTSVDVVTVAGAGGKFISLLESYKSNEALTFVDESLEEEGNMSITKEEFESAIAELKAAFVEALTPVVESVSILAEAAKPAEEIEGEETPALDPVEVAEKFNESGLPKIALTRVAESMKSESNTKTVDELIAEEVAYATAIRGEVVAEAAAPAAAVVGNIKESAEPTTLIDEFEAIVSRAKKG
jgi:hypothetical protein